MKSFLQLILEEKDTEKTASIAVFRYKRNRGLLGCEVLLGRKKSGDWVLPGGHILEGEKLEAGALRELKEETNINLSSLYYIGRVGWHHLYAAIVGKIAVKAGSDLQEVVWFDIESLPNMSYNHNKFVTISLRKLFSGD